MDSEKITDTAVYGVSDISGVKNVALSAPDGEECDEPCVADTAEKAVQNTENEFLTNEENEATLDAEFEKLINGKFGKAYRKRTEGIIRKRLRSVKAHTESEKRNASESDTPENDVSESNVETMAKGVNTAKNGFCENNKSNNAESEAVKKHERSCLQNKNRPIENGLCGSSGIINKINVSALDGKEILAIIKRVGTGEKISFK